MNHVLGSLLLLANLVAGSQVQWSFGSDFPPGVTGYTFLKPGSSIPRIVTRVQPSNGPVYMNEANFTVYGSLANESYINLPAFEVLSFIKIAGIMYISTSTGILKSSNGYWTGMGTVAPAVLTTNGKNDILAIGWPNNTVWISKYNSTSQQWNYFPVNGLSNINGSASCALYANGKIYVDFQGTSGNTVVTSSDDGMSWTIAKVWQQTMGNSSMFTSPQGDLMYIGQLYDTGPIKLYRNWVEVPMTGHEQISVLTSAVNTPAGLLLSGYSGDRFTILYSGDVSAGIADNETTRNIILFPNPCMDKLHITCSSKNFSLFDANGSLIEMLEIENGVIETTSLGTGMYFLKGESGESLRFIKH